ncbi:ATP-binding protein [Microbispora cellulosiformans]|uniref:ATP-binding protein n=1 Tax=Microbispora cellulosiformans TaxID=2614688 RepID=A0A5J5KB98_9ACTN|nr:ATP-binding protein [Microbispora cellulosiformans]KAA9381553.1 ATP-binding protein [Microbispora cellulosiformans]
MKPAHIFDRDREWAALRAFAESPSPEMRLAVVSGRRRQGKTFLLQALADVYGGFYFVAVESTSADALRQFGTAVAAYLGVPGTLAFANWDEAIVHLLDHCGDRLIVLDEFPYLTKADPSIPSILQREIDGRGAHRAAGSRVRLVLAGSAMSVMGRLLAGQAPLRGRASLDLVVQPFDHRLARRFWGIEDTRLALQVNAIVGGTPAYRTGFVDHEAPGDDLGDWVVRRVLDPAVPLFREARYLLTNEMEIRDEALYHAVLGAIAAGNNTRGGIAGHMERKATDIAHPLAVLEDCRLIRREIDPIRKRSLFRVAEPLVTFYEAIMRPAWSLLERGWADRVWRGAGARFAAQVVGPHFEHVCREFALAHDWNGEYATEVAAGIAPGGGRGQNIEVDVIALAPQDDHPRRLLSVGEAKWSQTMNVGHLKRLEQARDQLHTRGLDTRDTVLALYSGAGFDPELTEAAARDPRVLLVDLPLLYGGA